MKRQQGKTMQGGEKKTAVFPVLPFDFQGGIRQLLLTYTFFKESKEISSNLRNFFQSSKEICGTGSESPAYYHNKNACKITSVRRIDTKFAK